MGNHLILPLLIILIQVPTIGMPISVRDTLTAECKGVAAIYGNKPSGAWASEDGIASIGIRHWFSDRIGADIEIKASRTVYVPGIVEGSIGWHASGFAADAGILSDRLGAARLYRPHSLENPFVEQPLLWDTWGYGFRVSPTFAGAGFQAGVTINNRESGAARLMYHQSTSHFTWTVLAGFQSYSVENQDNAIIGGYEVTGSWGWFILHSAAKYVRYTGFDSNQNPSMVPGWLTDGFIEARAVILSWLTATDLCYVNVNKKSYDHHSVFNGTEVEAAITEWMSAGADVEYLVDYRATIKPGVFAVVKPFRGHSEVRVGCGLEKTGNAATTYGVTGELWFAF